MGDQSKTELVVIGCGAMGGAVLRGGARAGALAPKQTLVVEPDAGTRGTIEAELGVRTSAGVEAAAEALRAGARVLLAVKPQTLDSVGAALRAAGAPPTGLVVSILAGAGSARVREALGGACRVVRVMPNLPAQIGMGMSALAPGAGASAPDAAWARGLFAAVGEVIEIDETLIDAFTALAGSGPAYLFLLAEGMRAGGVAAGFDEATADRVVRAVLRGSSALLAQTPERSAEAWRAAVTSKGGTTEAALRELEGAGLVDALRRAVVAARDRGRELGEGSTR